MMEFSEWFMTRLGSSSPNVTSENMHPYTLYKCRCNFGLLGNVWDKTDWYLIHRGWAERLPNFFGQA